MFVSSPPCPPPPSESSLVVLGWHSFCLDPRGAATNGVRYYACKFRAHWVPFCLFVVKLQSGSAAYGHQVVHAHPCPRVCMFACPHIRVHMHPFTLKGIQNGRGHSHPHSVLPHPLSYFSRNIPAHLFMYPSQVPMHQRHTNHPNQILKNMIFYRNTSPTTKIKKTYVIPNRGVRVLPHTRTFVSLSSTEPSLWKPATS